ncbi:hypothetical protein TNCV_4623231 [Trichonephila clavipes]|nr:hypothetical protein TNCV_4623231 [Trichonephila clavipes]
MGQKHTPLGVWVYLNGSIRETRKCPKCLLGFGNDPKMTEISVDIAVQVALELQCRIKTGILAITASRCRRSSASFLVRQLSAAMITTVFKATRGKRIHVRLSYGYLRCYQDSIIEPPLR